MQRAPMKLDTMPSAARSKRGFDYAHVLRRGSLVIVGPAEIGFCLQ